MAQGGDLKRAHMLEQLKEARARSSWYARAALLQGAAGVSIGALAIISEGFDLTGFVPALVAVFFIGLAVFNFLRWLGAGLDVAGCQGDLDDHDNYGGW